MGVKKLQEYPIQLMSLDAITVDRALQSRVSTSIEYQREFSEAMLRGDEFPPITVFFDGKKHWLADGFHRHGAAKKAGLKAIRAEVREGTKRDATIFSAGANQKFSIPRTAEDRRKAIEMVLSDSEGLRWSLSRIAKHVGVSSPTVAKCRAEFCARNGLAVPTDLKGEDGRTYARAEEPPNVVGSMSGYFYTKIRGNTHALGRDLKEARARAAELLKADREERARLAAMKADKRHVVSSHYDRVFYAYSAQGFVFSAQPDRDMLRHGITGRLGHGCVVLALPETDSASVVSAVGRVLLSRLNRDPGARMVILCERGEVAPDLVLLAGGLGVEFFTSQEFLESLQAEKQP